MGTTEVPLTAAQIKENDRLESLNAKAMSILYCGLNKAEYNHISSCETAKQIWSRVEVTHEGTTKVKASRIRMLSQLFEIFKMQDNETLDSLFFTLCRYCEPSKVAWENLSEEDQITKLLYSLKGNDWTQKRSIIEATQNLAKMTFEGLMGNLKAHEVQLGVDSGVPVKEVPKLEVKKPKEERNMAFKALRGVHFESSDSSDDDVEAVVRRLVKVVDEEERQEAWEARQGKVCS